MAPVCFFLLQTSLAGKNTQFNGYTVCVLTTSSAIDSLAPANHLASTLGEDVTRSDEEGAQGGEYGGRVSQLYHSTWYHEALLSAAPKSHSAANMRCTEAPLQYFPAVPKLLEVESVCCCVGCCFW